MGIWLEKLQEEKEYSMDLILGVMTAKEEQEHKDLRDKAASNGGVRIMLNDGTQVLLISLFFPSSSPSSFPLLLFILLFFL